MKKIVHQACQTWRSRNQLEREPAITPVKRRRNSLVKVCVKFVLFLFFFCCLCPAFEATLQTRVVLVWSYLSPGAGAAWEARAMAAGALSSRSIQMQAGAYIAYIQ